MNSYPGVWILFEMLYVVHFPTKDAINVMAGTVILHRNTSLDVCQNQRRLHNLTLKKLF